MPKGRGRPYNRREKQAVATLKDPRVSTKTGRGFQANQMLLSRGMKDMAREYSNSPGGTSRKTKESVSKKLRELSRQKRGLGMGIKKPPKGFE